MMTKLRLILPYVFLFLLTAFVLNLANPLFDKPARDGGFFLYAGSQIMDGKIPYRDFWDSKGPGIFYINALGLLVGGGSRWGVWFVEFLFLFGTLLILYRSLSKRWGLGAALFGITLAGLGLQVVLGYGNYTEEYALLFNAAGLALFFSMTDGQRNDWKYFGIGALFGLSFTFRANNIGGLFAVLFAVFVFNVFKRNFADAMKTVLATLAGFALPLLLWTIYFAFAGSAREMIYASLIFNFSYSAAKEREWLDIFGGFGKYGMSWYGWFTLLAWIVVVISSIIRFAQRQLSLFEVFLLFWFPIEIVLSNLSGRNFTHYYISWMLAVAVYAAFVFAEFWEVTFKVSAFQGWSESFGATVSVLLILGLFLVFPSTWTRYGKTFGSFGKEYIDPVSAYIHDNTSPGDLLLTWYPDTGINFMSGRASPVKYVYYPLFLEGSLTKEIEDSYIQDVTTKQPEIILDCSRSVDAIPSLDLATREVQYDTPGLKKKMYIQLGMDDIFDFVTKNYHIENTIDDCIIFRLNSN